MGGLASTLDQRSPEDLEIYKKANDLQNLALDFTAKMIFEGIPVRSARKTNDYITSIWIEPLPELYEDAIKLSGTVDNNIATGFPSGVLIDKDAKTTINFALTDVSYSFTVDEIINYNTLRQKEGLIPVPEPPTLKVANVRSLIITWTHLPLPIGLIVAVEVQYMKVDDDDESEEEDQYSDIYQGRSFYCSGKARWSALVNKYYSQKTFSEFDWDGLGPGTSMRCRLRYRHLGGWSDYSLPSEVYRTLPERPLPPHGLTCTAITSHAVEFVWVYPRRDNGAKVTSYILEGRGAGDTEFLEVYRGPRQSYLALGLYPNFVYTFQVAAVNAIGQSDFSTYVSVQTPVKSKGGLNRSGDRLNNPTLIVPGFNETQVNAALRCSDAWVKHWDPKTEQAFYFNTILGVRQLVMPDVLWERQQQEKEEEEEDNQKQIQNPEKLAEEKQKMFRLKRYRLLRSLHRNMNNNANINSLDSSLDPWNQADNNIARENVNQEGLSNIADLLVESTVDQLILENQRVRQRVQTSSSSLRRGKKEVLNMLLRRKYLLADAFQLFAKLHPEDLLRRLKVQFEGEDGIDSGGLSKEAFLLLSKAASEFVGYKHKKWMVSLKSEVIQSLKPVKPTINNNKNNTLTSESTKAAEIMEGLFFASELNENDVKIVKRVDPRHQVKEQFLFLTVEEIIDLDTKYKVSGNRFFHFLGRVFGKALYDRQLLDFPFSSLLLQHMLGGFIKQQETNTVSPINSKINTKRNKHTDKDELKKNENVLKLCDELKYLDKDLHTSLSWILNNDITGVIFENFSVSPGNDLPEIPLCAGGCDREVTEENKLEYVQLMIYWRTTYSVSSSLEPFLKGFHEIIPLTVLQQVEINRDELFLILNGKREVDVEEIRAYCIYQPLHSDDISADAFNESHDTVIWLWRALREMTDSQRRGVLLFFTGSSRVPLDGYDPPINITEGNPDDLPKNSLPRAHTCFNQLVLPEYSTYEDLKDKLLFAVENTDGFLLA